MNCLPAVLREVRFLVLPIQVKQTTSLIPGMHAFARMVDLFGSRNV